MYSMPNIYGVGKVWCTHCGESRDSSYDTCPDCKRMLRRSTRQRIFKTEKARVA